MGRLRAAMPLVAWLGSLVAGLVLFTQLGDGPLAAPAVLEPSTWSAWAAERDPVIVGLALLRLLVLALAWYLVGVTTVGLVARVLRLARLVRIADAMSGPVVRHVLRSALGVSLAVSVVASSAGAGPRTATDDVDRGEVATAVALTDDASAGDASADDASAEEAPDAPVATARAVAMADGPGGDTVAAMSPVGDEAPATERMVGLPPPVAQPTAEVVDEDDATAPAEHEVRDGEHLWSIAADTVATSLDRAPSDAEVHAYWQVLIEDNRDRLADPDNPDLIFPGQRLVLPDVDHEVGA